MDSSSKAPLGSVQVIEITKSGGITGKTHALRVDLGRLTPNQQQVLRAQLHQIMNELAHDGPTEFGNRAYCILIDGRELLRTAVYSDVPVTAQRLWATAQDVIRTNQSTSPRKSRDDHTR